MNIQNRPINLTVKFRENDLKRYEPVDSYTCHHFCKVHWDTHQSRTDTARRRNQVCIYMSKRYRADDDQDDKHHRFDKVRWRKNDQLFHSIFLKMNGWLIAEGKMLNSKKIWSETKKSGYAWLTDGYKNQMGNLCAANPKIGSSSTSARRG